MEGYSDCQIPCVQLRHIYPTLSIICFDIIYLHMHYTRVHNPDMCTHIYTCICIYIHIHIYSTYNTYIYTQVGWISWTRRLSKDRVPKQVTSSLPPLSSSFTSEPGRWGIGERWWFHHPNGDLTKGKMTSSMLFFPIKHEDLPSNLFRRSWGYFFGGRLKWWSTWVTMLRSGNGQWLYGFGQHWGFTWTNIGYTQCSTHMVAVPDSMAENG